MSPAETLQLVSDATQAVIDLSFAGIRRRHPAASDRECFPRFACMVLGPMSPVASILTWLG